MWETCGEIQDGRCVKCRSTESEIASVQTSTGAECITWEESHGSAYGLATIGWHRVHEIWLVRSGSEPEPMPPTEDYPEQGIRWLIGKAKQELRNFQWRGKIRTEFPDFNTYVAYVMGDDKTIWDDAVEYYQSDPAVRLRARNVVQEIEKKLKFLARRKAEAAWLASHPRPPLRSTFKHRLRASKAVAVYVSKQPSAHPWKPETWYGPDSEISVYIEHQEIDPASLGISPEDVEL